jgi:hypothetical protein
MAKIENIIKPDGTPAKGILMDFTVKREDWNEYELSDGTRLRMKNSLVKAYLIVDDDGNSIMNDDGEPEVFIRHTTLVVSRKQKD